MVWEPGALFLFLPPFLLILSQETFFVSASLFHATSQATQPARAAKAAKAEYILGVTFASCGEAEEVALSRVGLQSLPMNNGLATAVCT